MTGRQLKQFGELVTNILKKHSDDVSEYVIDWKVISIHSAEYGEKVDHLVPTLYISYH